MRFGRTGNGLRHDSGRRPRRRHPLGGGPGRRSAGLRGLCRRRTRSSLLERLDGDRPALAIVEVELPGSSSGLELLRELHERFGEDLPVILVSAERTDALDRVAGLLLGADDYLAKPFDSGELLARVRRSLRRSGAGRSERKRPQEADVATSISAGASARFSRFLPTGSHRRRSRRCSSSARRPLRRISSTFSRSSESTAVRRPSR